MVDDARSDNAVYPDTDTKDFLIGSGSDEANVSCCSTGDYTFYSIFDGLNNITSNIIITISTDVLLSSKVIIEGIYTITIIGHGNPIVNCNNFVSVKFFSSAMSPLKASNGRGVVLITNQE